ncbi:MAG: hypothetical protein AABM42_05535, partial [Actinomycetota bacterium]
RMRIARKPSAVARELLRNFPKSGGKRRRRRGKNGQRSGNGGGNGVKNGGDTRGRDRTANRAPRERIAESEPDASQD